MKTTLEGGCLCGDVRYRIAGTPQAEGGICYCYACRLTSGGPCVGWNSFCRRDFAPARGKPIRYRFVRQRGDGVEMKPSQ